MGVESRWLRLTVVAVFIARYFFFFQAEDGIRDHCVTGVQTCGLPILPGVLATFNTILKPIEKPFLYGPIQLA